MKSQSGNEEKLSGKRYAEYGRLDKKRDFMNTFLLVVVGLMVGMVLLAMISPIITVCGFLVAVFGLVTGNGIVAGCGALAWMIGAGFWLYVSADPVYKVN